MDVKAIAEFQDKCVVVTGASSGIGEAIAIELARRGAKPVLVGRNIEKLRATASQLGLPDHFVLPLDLSDHAAILPGIMSVSKRTGRIYGLCHAAGIADTVPLNSCSVDKMKRMMDVNLISGIEMARAVCRRDIMTEKGGSILFIASIYALIGMAGEIGYSACKGGIMSAARAMAIELARRRIRVNVLSPGLVKTRMTDQAFAKLSAKYRKEIEDSHPLGTGMPDDVARAAVFLLDPQNKWITGANLTVDGGYTAR
jgi:NAD(P)-dependent dehydrogenase (short-subunit alcohol dehydrogenase family)